MTALTVPLLTQLIADKWTYRDIARRYGMGETTVRNWANKHNIAQPKRHKLPDAAELVELMKTETAAQIAARYGASPDSIYTKVSDARRRGEIAEHAPAAHTPRRQDPNIDWEQAPCRQIDDPDAMFPTAHTVAESGVTFPRHTDVDALLRATCDRCPFRGPCVEGAVQCAEPWGLWGGRAVVHGKAYPVRRGHQQAA